MQSPETGRDALNNAFDARFPTERDFRFGLGSTDDFEAPFAEVVAYMQPFARTPYWFFGTYGFSELGVAKSGDLSGLGFELTLRVAAENFEEPPRWPLSFLRRLGLRIRSEERAFGAIGRDADTEHPLFDHGHSMPLNNELRGSPATAMFLDEHARARCFATGGEMPLGGLAFQEDPEFGTLNTENGRMQFLQVLPLSDEEFSLFGRWNATPILAEIAALDPDGLWRPAHDGILGSPRRTAIEARAALDGSSQSVDYTNDLTWHQDAAGTSLFVDGIHRKIVAKFLRYRVAYGRSAVVHSETRSLHLVPEVDKVSFARAGDVAHLRIDPKRAILLAERLEKALPGTGISLADYAVEPAARPFANASENAGNGVAGAGSALSFVCVA